MLEFENEIEFVERQFSNHKGEGRIVNYIEVPVFKDGQKEASLFLVSEVDFKEWISLKGMDWKSLAKDHDDLFKELVVFVKEEMIGREDEVISNLKSKIIGHQIKENVLFDTIERLRDEIERLKSANDLTEQLKKQA